MRSLLALALVTLTIPLSAQEKKVPKDSVRLSIPGCVDGRTFIVMRREEAEPVQAEIEPGRRFHLNGPKNMLKEMQAQKATMVQITGLIRRSQMTERGVSAAGGRVRIGGDQPQAPVGGGAGRAPVYNDAILDVESWRSLPDTCPRR